MPVLGPLLQQHLAARRRTTSISARFSGVAFFGLRTGSSAVRPVA